MGMSQEDRQAAKEIMKGRTFCMYPFVQISTVPPGFARPCCFFGEPNADEQGDPLVAGRNSFAEIWNCSSIKKVRNQMLTGKKVKSCYQCYSEEQVGKSSMRFRSFDEWGDNEGAMARILESQKLGGKIHSNPKYLELKPGNLCNLKCRICNQQDSNQVGKELVELSKKLEDPEIAQQARLFDNGYFQAVNKTGMVLNWGELDSVWDEIDEMLPDLELISLAGGEPPMLAGVHRLLRRCVETGHASHIKVFLSSNFTKLNPSLIENSQHFKYFEFIASIDGYKEIQEYIRHPSAWQVVSENYRKIKRKSGLGNIRSIVNLTVSLNNILHFTDLLDWLDELDREVIEYHYYPYNLNLLIGPRYLCYEILPPQARRVAIERIEKYMERSPSLKQYPPLREKFDLIVRTLSGDPPKDTRDQLQTFWKFTKILDEHRQESLKNVDPLLFDSVKNFLQPSSARFEGRL